MIQLVKPFNGKEPASNCWQAPLKCKGLDVGLEAEELVQLVQ